MDHILNALAYVIAWFNALPPDTWRNLALFGASTGLTTILLEFYKRHKRKKLEEITKRAIVFVMATLSFVFTYISSFIEYGNVHPGFLGSNTFQIMGFALVLYHFGMSKTYKKIAATVNAWLADSKNAEIARTARLPEITPVQPIAPEKPAGTTMDDLV